MCRRTGRRTAALTTALYSTIFCLMGFYVGCKGPLLLTLADQTRGPVAEMGAWAITNASLADKRV